MGLLGTAIPLFRCFGTPRLVMYEHGRVLTGGLAACPLQAPPKYQSTRIFVLGFAQVRKLRPWRLRVQVLRHLGRRTQAPACCSGFRCTESRVALSRRSPPCLRALERFHSVL